MRKSEAELSSSINSFEFFSGFEIRYALGRNADRVTGLWISAPTRATLPHAKTTEATQFDLLTLIQSFNDTFEDNLY